MLAKSRLILQLLQAPLDGLDRQFLRDNTVCHRQPKYQA